MRKILISAWLVLACAVQPMAIAAESGDAANPVKPVEKSFLSQAEDVLSYALSLTGVPYKFGGRTPETGLDCSGFVSYVFRQVADVRLPHNALAMSLIGDRIPHASELRPGDLVFFNTRRRNFSHVGIYAGDNRFIHAPSSGGSVMLSNMTDKYWNKRYNGARRLPLPQGFDPVAALPALE